MKKSIYILFSIFLFSFIINVKTFIDIPEYFPKPVYNFNNNPLDSNIIELGRHLFYDPILSADSTISCASCHSPFNAFAHTDHDLSHGINDEIGTRNAPAIFNLAWQKDFMWDGAINHLDVQALAPISHPKEMGSSINEVITKLNESVKYKNMFELAFNNTEINSKNILLSLSQFQLTLISANSKYDRVQLNKDTFNSQEENGYKLFKKNCNSCHTEPLFSNYKFKNNGLEIDTTLKDFGRYKITTLGIDSLQFKVPSLRNLSFSYPYMHDGRFNKLKEVIDHYTDGIEKSKYLSTELKNRIKLSDNEKIDLISFLLTLNDKEFVFNKKHLFPR